MLIIDTFMVSQASAISDHSHCEFLPSHLGIYSHGSGLYTSVDGVHIVYRCATQALLDIMLSARELGNLRGAKHS